MSCIVSVRRADDSPLGDRAAVEQTISSAFPGVRYYREPSGLEKIAVMRARAIEFPEVLRRYLEQQAAARQGDLAGDGFTMRFFLGSGTELDSLHVELRGETERAAHLLRDWAALNGWVMDGGRW